MTTLRARSASPFLAGAALAAAAGIGISAAFAVEIAIAVVLTVALGTLLSLRPTAILSILVVTIFVEIVSLGSLTISRLIAPLALIIVVVLAARGRASIRPAPQLAWICAYSIWALASGLWTVSVGGTAFQLGSLAIALVYMLAFATLLNSRAELERVLWALALAALGVGLFAIGAFALGFSEDLKAGRASGGTGDPNFFATYQAMAFPLILVLAGETRRRGARLLLYGAAIVIVVSVLTSVSRGGLLTLGTVLLLMAVLPARTFLAARSQKAALLALVALGTGFALKETSKDILPRLEALYSHQQSSEARGSGRLDMWLAAGTSIRQRPILGLGYGGFASASPELVLQTPGIDLSTFDIEKAGQEAHSAYIGTTAELGLPGLLLLVGLVISTLRALRRTAESARDAGDEFMRRIANAVTLSLVAWGISSFFLSSETSRALWIVIGLSLALPKLVRGQAQA